MNDIIANSEQNFADTNLITLEQETASVDSSFYVYTFAHFVIYCK